MSNILPKPPTEVPIGQMALTGLGSSAMGDQIGDALSQILSWGIAVKCQCAPPPEISSAFHTLCISLVVGIAFYIHYRFARNLPPT